MLRHHTTKIKIAFEYSEAVSGNRWVRNGEIIKAVADHLREKKKALSGLKKQSSSKNRKRGS